MLAFVVATAFGASICLLVVRGVRVAHGYGQITDENSFPAPLKAFVKQTRDSEHLVEVFCFSSSFNPKYAWKIEGNQDFCQRMISESRVDRTDRNHPLLDETLRLMREAWPDFSFELSSCEYYASPGLGTARVEGVDLFFLIYEEKSQSVAVVYRKYW